MAAPLPDDAMERLVTEVDEMLRTKLDASGVDAMHVVLLLPSDGPSLIRSNVDADVLADLGAMIGDAAKEARLRERRVGSGSPIKRPD